MENLLSIIWPALVIICVQQERKMTQVRPRARYEDGTADAQCLGQIEHISLDSVYSWAVTTTTITPDDAFSSFPFFTWCTDTRQV
jgi:hypothetical protein